MYLIVSICIVIKKKILLELYEEVTKQAEYGKIILKYNKSVYL